MAGVNRAVPRAQDSLDSSVRPPETCLDLTGTAHMEVSTWLRDLGLDDYVQAFQANHIDAEVLPRLTADDLTAIGITSVGHRRRLLDAIAAFDQLRAATAAEPSIVAVRPVEAERRQLTVLFCDLVGSTELAARLDPEDLREVMRAYQKACACVIGRFEGHLARFLGDGVLAYFSWPRAHEDDAERAVRAGLQLVGDVARLEPRPGMRLQARVGVATGHVVVGDLIGEGVSDRDAVSGDTPNLAARLQALAASGSVVISQATRRLIGGLFELTDLGPQRLKGFAEPLSAWQVEGQGRAEGRFEARHSAGLTPLVGREEEIALLMRRWEQARDGEGQVVLLSGEPGVGKSRLVRELRERLGAEPHDRLTFQCSPYYQTSPLHPVVEHLERAAGFEREDLPEARLAKLEALLARGTDKRDQAVPLIAALLGVPTGGRYSIIDLTPQRQKELTLEALLEQLVALAAEQPVLVVHEDVHWIDPTTQELLSLAIERTQRLPVLMIITFRPEFVSPWPGQPHVSEVALTRLDRREGAAMVDRVMGAKPLPAEVRAQIVAKTDGVPLFVEELTKAVLESGLLADAGDHYELSGPLPPLAIPATLHDSLLARLDRLAAVKEVAQIGAAIGREFSDALLAAVTDRPEDQLHDALDQLVSSELVFRRGTPPEATYSFKHALVQDAAYGTLLKSRRQHLHARIAQVLEEQFPEIAESQPALLAHHSTEAGLTAKAVNYRRRAARLAVARSAHLEAIAEATKGLEALAGLPDGPERRRQELDLQLALGRGFLIARGEAAPETGAAYSRAVEVCAQVDEIAQMFPALYGRLLFHWARGELLLAHEQAHQFVEIAQDQDEPSARATGTQIIGMISLQLGRPSAARSYLEQALEQSSGYHSTQAFIYPYHPRVDCLSYMSATFLTLGYPDKALSFVRQALAEAQVLGHPDSIAYAIKEAAGFYQDVGNVQAVQEQAEQLIALATEQGYPYFLAEGRLYQAWALGQQGRVGEAIRQMRQAISAMRVAHKGIGMPYRLLLLAGMHMGARQAPDGLDVLTEALTLVESTGERWFEAELHRVRGKLLLALPEPDQPDAEACFHQALAVAREQDARMWELRAATSLARLWAEQGKRSEARDLLAPVYCWFTEGFDTADLKDAKALLEELA
jgi:class 3 adenylate cyclase/predicted ATPase